jgi:hypothetical protein
MNCLERGPVWGVRRTLTGPQAAGGTGSEKGCSVSAGQDDPCRVWEKPLAWGHEYHPRQVDTAPQESFNACQ